MNDVNTFFVSCRSIRIEIPSWHEICFLIHKT